ncbi:hypothetical protein, partial [Sansalvadorimonas verongulae]|uniref:hypothetical protein n=1 Tax=Sansalvadorimonas verongulae TaxID=2172824 RepID=UPI0012BB4B11
MPEYERPRQERASHRRSDPVHRESFLRETETRHRPRSMNEEGTRRYERHPMGRDIEQVYKEKVDQLEKAIKELGRVSEKDTRIKNFDDKFKPLALELFEALRDHPRTWSASLCLVALLKYAGVFMYAGDHDKAAYWYDLIEQFEAHMTPAQKRNMYPKFRMALDKVCQRLFR